MEHPEPEFAPLSRRHRLHGHRFSAKASSLSLANDPTFSAFFPFFLVMNCSEAAEFGGERDGVNNFLPSPDPQ
ncbi:unnamed protein product [Linum trigynum]|uniref:Uncharacterized protein n=1 Tax=Linum trigynum TaxID=586398 RepID=A0AAV2EPB1_9ROSI